MDWLRKYRKIWEFLGLVVAWPALAYFAIFQTFTVDEYRDQHTAAALLGSGLAAWIVLRIKRP